GRVGGEEFLIVSPGADSNIAYGLALRILDGIRSSPLDCNVGLTITASAGVADMNSSDESIDTLMGRADAALYHAKDNGRDRVETA
ncbi:MAG: GGDEF domain-containing protein, partial [Coriobacteriia bacterium]|nr:GGDEF domain-containing protein [Coriobacteriia bacterium]